MASISFDDFLLAWNGMCFRVACIACVFFLGAREITLFDSARYALAAIFCFIIDEDFLLAEIRIWHQKEGSWNQNYLAVANWWLMVNFDLVKDFCWRRTLLCSRQTLVYTSSNSTEKINDSRKKCVPVFIWRKGGVFSNNLTIFRLIWLISTGQECSIIQLMKALDSIKCY